MNVRGLQAGCIMLALGGCVVSKPNPLNHSGVTPKPYDGLTRLSYGTLTNSSIRYCSNNGDPLAESLRDLGRSIIGGIYKPMGAATVYDDTVIKEDLQDQFRSIGNIVAANVVILSRSDDGITFWYNSDEASQAEVASAATKFCSQKKHKTADSIGHSQRCGPTTTVPSVLRVNGQGSPTRVTPTYVIEAFSCG